MTAAQNGRTMKELPRPSIDMCDGATATWLHQLADHYTGYEARYIRDLANRMMRQHEAALKAEANKRAEKIKDLHEILDSVDDERRTLDDDEEDARTKLAELMRGSALRPSIRPSS